MYNFIDIARASETTETETTATGANESVAAALGLNPTLFVFQLINFALVAAVLWWLILKPLTKKMSERQNIIEKSLDDAKKVEANLHNSEKKYQEKIDEAKVEANKIVDKAVKDARAASEDIKKKAKVEIEMLVDQAKRNIAIDREEMISSVRQEAANLVVMALEKVLAEKMTEAKDKALVEEMIKKMK